MIWQAWSDSGKVYAYRKLTNHLRDQGERISENRVARLASMAGIAAQVGYKRLPGRYGEKPAVVAENRLEQCFDASQPVRIWVNDITYIKTHEGWLHLCIVVDLFSRRVVGWSAQSRMTTDLDLQALLMAVWRRKYGMAEGIIYNWKAKFGGLTVSEANRLKVLEEEKLEAEEAVC